MFHSKQHAKTSNPETRLSRDCPQVRNCSLSTLHAVSALLPVLVLELLVTLAYSCVCVVLYHGVKDAPFTSLRSAFINLFALSTTVNDPDVWMPLYDRCDGASACGDHGARGDGGGGCWLCI